MSDRLALATTFVAALHAASRKNPESWRRVDAIGKGAGIEDPEQQLAHIPSHERFHARPAG